MSEISNIFGSKQTHKHSCLKCADDVKKESVVLACNLVITLRNKTFFELKFKVLIGLGLSYQRTRT